jgi:hypothetical protein
MKRWIGAALVLGTLTGCGGTSSNGGGDEDPGPRDDNPFFGPDPVPPPAQGAVVFSVKPIAPAPAGTSCPASAFTSSVPDTSMAPVEALDADNYQHKVIDGDQGAVLRCRVATVADGFEFEANIQLASRSLRLAGGTLSANRTGSAIVTVVDSLQLGESLTSSEPCAVNAAKGNGNNFQVKAGSMWASFTCTSVAAPPSSACAADGFFVLENCTQN